MLVAKDKNPTPWSFAELPERIKSPIWICRSGDIEGPRAGGSRKMKEQMDHRRAAQGSEEFADHAELVDDPGRIEKYRAIALAVGLQQGSESQVRWAWQWLNDHPEITNELQEWFAFRVAELKSMGQIK